MRPMTLEEVSLLYDARASIPFDGTTNRDETEQALDLTKQIAPALDSRMLDVGCGAGWLLAAMHGAGYRRIAGLDISARSLRLAAELCQATTAVFILGAAGSAAPAAFDAVTAFNACLGCFGPDGDQAFVNGLHRALAPGGRMVLSHIGPAAARRRVGEYRASYRRGAETVTSSVQLDPSGDWLVVNQRLGEKPIGEERIAVLTRDRVAAMLRQAGFGEAEHLQATDRAGVLPFVDIVAATKRP